MSSEPTAFPKTTVIIKGMTLGANLCDDIKKHISAIECSAPHKIKAGTPSNVYHWLLDEFLIMTHALIIKPQIIALPNI